jgi:hypothetical protein
VWQAKYSRYHEVGIREACAKTLTVLGKAYKPLDSVEFIVTIKRLSQLMPGGSLFTVEETST